MCSSVYNDIRKYTSLKYKLFNIYDNNIHTFCVDVNKKSVYVYLYCRKRVMKYSELIYALKNLINYEPKQIELCRILDIKPTAMSARVQRNSDFSIDEIEKIEKKYNIKINSSDGFITLRYFPKNINYSIDNEFKIEGECVEYKLPENIFPYGSFKNVYSMCRVKMYDMKPLINYDDFVIFESNSDMEIRNGELYIFYYDKQIYLKRLCKNINQIVVLSENPDFTTQYIEKSEIKDLKLIGRVICHGRVCEEYIG